MNYRALPIPGKLIKTSSYLWLQTGCLYETIQICSDLFLQHLEPDLHLGYYPNDHQSLGLLAYADMYVPSWLQCPKPYGRDIS